MRRIQFLLALLAALCLPLHAVAATAMMLAHSESSTSNAQMQMNEHAGCEMMQSGKAASTAPSQSHGKCAGCNSCGVCGLSSLGGVLPMRVVAVPSPASSSVPVLAQIVYANPSFAPLPEPPRPV